MKDIPRYEIDTPCQEVPEWALLERRYLELADTAPDVLADYLPPEG